ncbi:GIY-YIG nuclease family protein [Candidatus Falkowbacteria bacterium]|nr:GIY-YIG nuclease family protein [Candidatus Falkowbacteria bacterium]
MIKNENNDLYIGITQNPNNRLQAHNTNNGANFTKDNGIFCIVFLEEYPTLQEARQREVQLKKWRRSKKDFLVERYSQGLTTKQAN